MNLIQIFPQRVFVICLTAIAFCTNGGSRSQAQGEPALNETPALKDLVERQIEGWTIVLDPEVLNEEHREVGEAALVALANHLQRIRYILPKEKVQELQKLRIWVDWDHPLGNMQYHPSRGWLVRNGHDPRLEKHVHGPRAKALLSPSQWAKHPYVVLHELAHAYHDQVLGFDQSEIVQVFDQAKAAGIYERVKSHTGRRVKHYALTNHKEYFAESTEAYLGVNDFYPFVRAELEEHDPRMYALMQKIWGKVR
ncbi:MAG: metallopeptidase [Planctomycetota bacterium]